MSHLIKFATACVILLSCGQLHPSEPRFDQDPELTLERIFQRWNDAAREVSVVDIRLQRFVYNPAFKTCKVSTGRFYCHKDIGFHLKLDDASVPQKNAATGYEIRPASPEFWVSRRDAILDIRAERQEALRLILRRDIETATNDSRWFPYLSQFRDANDFLITLGHGAVPKLLQKNFDLTVHNSESGLLMQCYPRTQPGRDWCSSVSFLFKDNAPVPNAVRIIDSAKTKRTVYLITSHTFNQIAADKEHLLYPDLAGFRVQTIR